MKKHPMSGRVLPRNNDEKEIVVIGKFIAFNDPNVSFETEEDYKRWNLKKISKQALEEKKDPGIYLYNIVKQSFSDYTQLNEDQLTRTCRYFNIPVPKIEVREGETFTGEEAKNSVLVRYEFF